MNNKIIHVPRRFVQEEWGGTESVILNLCKQQLKSFKPEIHTSKALKKLSKEIWKNIPIFRYFYVYPFFGLSSAEKHALDKKGGNLISLCLFFHLLISKNVRVFHSHVIKRMGGEVLTTARIKGKPCVVTLHGNIFDVPKSEADSIVESQKGHFEWGKIFGLIFGSRNLLEKADAVICVGYSEFVSAKSKLSHDRVYYLPNGVNPDSFAIGDRVRGRSKLKLTNDDIVFGCISRIDPQKGQKFLIEAFIELASKNSEIHLLLAGPITSENYRNSLNKIISGSNVSDRIHWLPSVETESGEHADLLAALDVFVLASRHEPFGIVILEAWAAGKPVIVSSVGGLVKLVDDTIDGLKVEPESVEDLTTAMKTLIDNEELRIRLGNQGKIKVNESYSWEKINKMLEEIYCAAEAYNKKR